jgi:hypothetical protein
MRLYYWIKGAPEGRPGGPWWYRDFGSRDQLNSFLGDLKPFLHAYAITSVAVEIDDSLILPPESAVKLVE